MPDIPQSPSRRSHTMLPPLWDAQDPVRAERCVLLLPALLMDGLQWGAPAGCWLSAKGPVSLLC